MLRIAGRDINDECQNCGEVLQCELFRQGHGIGRKRENITEMLRCQIEHVEERRLKNDSVR